MKTRIIVNEYNSGKKEFVCEYKKFVLANFLLMNLIPVLGTVAALIYVWDRWGVLKKRLPDLISLEGKQPTQRFTDAVFDNMEDAKKFIDEKQQEETDMLYEQHKNEVKKTYKVKYPSITSQK